MTDTHNVSFVATCPACHRGFRVGTNINVESMTRGQQSIDLRAERLLNKLTLRDREVVGLVIVAKMNHEIARITDATENAVKLRLSRVFEKMNVRDRTHLAVTVLSTPVLRVAVEDAAAPILRRTNPTTVVVEIPATKRVA